MKLWDYLVCSILNPFDQNGSKLTIGYYSFTQGLEMKSRFYTVFENTQDFRLLIVFR